MLKSLVSFTIGPIQDDTKLDIKMSVEEETKDKAPFDLTVKVNVEKFMVFRYVAIPTWAMDAIGSAFPYIDPRFTYLGDSTFKISCPTNTTQIECLPAKGDHEQLWNLKEYFEKFFQKIGSMKSFMNGWSKVNMVASSDKLEKNVWCFDFEVNMSF